MIHQDPQVLCHANIPSVRMNATQQRKALHRKRVVKPELNSGAFKEVLRFDQENNRVYFAPGKDIRGRLTTRGIRKKTEVGDDQLDELINWVIKHHFLCPALQCSEGRGSEGAEELCLAVYYMCLACAKGVRESKDAMESQLSVNGNQLSSSTPSH